MKVWMKNLKLMAALSVIVVVFASASVAYGGLRWAGFDPELMVNGDQVNIYVEWPASYTCDVDDVHVVVSVPRGTDVTLVGESFSNFDCNGEAFFVESDTQIVTHGKKNAIKVMATVESDERFPVRLQVFENGQLQQLCEGRNNKVACKPLEL